MGQAGKFQIWLLFISDILAVKKHLYGIGHLHNNMYDTSLYSSLPYGSAKRRVQGACRDVGWLPQGPVVRCESSSQGALAQRDGKVDQPEEHEQVTQMQDEDVAVVHTFSTIEGKHALWPGTHFGNIGLTEGLKENNRFDLGVLSDKSTVS